MGSEKIKSGPHIKKQILNAWEYLKINMPEKWIIAVSKTFKEKFY